MSFVECQVIDRSNNVDTQQQQQHETIISRRQKCNLLSRKSTSFASPSPQHPTERASCSATARNPEICARRDRPGGGRGTRPLRKWATSRRRGLDIGREWIPVSGRDDRWNFRDLHALLSRHEGTSISLCTVVVVGAKPCGIR